MINDNYLINDGLNVDYNTSLCFNNNGLTWSYNQGVILGGLKYLSIIFEDKSSEFITLAISIMHAVNHTLTLNGILQEPASDSQVRSSNDQQQFKGIYMRYLNYFYQYLVEINSATSNYQKQIEIIKKFVDVQWKGILTVMNPLCYNEFDSIWSDAIYVKGDAIAETSAIDAWNWAFII